MLLLFENALYEPSVSLNNVIFETIEYFDIFHHKTNKFNQTNPNNASQDRWNI
jgi:hypothetical protein